MAVKETIKNSIDTAIKGFSSFFSFIKNEIFRLELMENNQLNFVDWLMKYPRQTVILVLKIMFTRLIEQNSKGNDLEQVRIRDEFLAPGFDLYLFYF